MSSSTDHRSDAAAYGGPSVARPYVVHVSGDFPDAANGAKTPVVRTLTELVADRFDQHVLSINRRAPNTRLPARPRGLLWPRLKVETLATGDVDVLRYRAPGRGVHHAEMLRQLGNWIAGRLSRDGVPALLVGHKLTIEGIAVAHAAAQLGIPYALSIQGNTDRRILTWRPDLRPLFRRIYHEAAVVFPFTPWARAFVEAKLGARDGPTVTLPCPTHADTIHAPAVSGGGIVTAFHLHNHRGKNAPWLIAAARRAASRDPRVSLAVVGGGSSADMAAMRRYAGQDPAVVLEGPLPHAEMPARLHRAAGFALPSLSESFGLVFIEALLGGLPILYPAGTAVDGYFDGLPFAIRVDPRSETAIADGLVRLVADEAALKAALAQWQRSPAAERFRRPAIARAFGDGLAGAVEG